MGRVGTLPRSPATCGENSGLSLGSLAQSCPEQYTTSPWSVRADLMPLVLVGSFTKAILQIVLATMKYTAFIPCPCGSSAIPIAVCMTVGKRGNDVVVRAVKNITLQPVPQHYLSLQLHCLLLWVLILSSPTSQRWLTPCGFNWNKNNTVAQGEKPRSTRGRVRKTWTKEAA